MDFSNLEMSRRLDEGRRRMRASGFDCLMLSGIENFSYFTGISTALYQHRRPWCVAIPLDGQPTIITMAGIDETMRYQGFFASVETYKLPVHTNFVEKVAEVISGFGPRTVGCELGTDQRMGMPALDFESIRGRMSDVSFVDAAPLLWSLRMFKSSEEVARMRRACEITGATRQALFQLVRPGMTEREIADLWSRLMVAAGAERPSFIYIHTGGPIDFLPKTYKAIQPGDTLWVDGGVYVGGYTCDFSRVATLGPASAQQKRLHGDAVEVTARVLEHVRPGATLRELATVCARAMSERGHAGYEDPGQVVAGHGMGMLINEPPLIGGWDDTPLEVGIVTGIELGPVSTAGMFVWEELIQVTEDGYELLTKELTQLVEIEVN